ncbi:MAG: C_GCAxxG_C_C family protein [Oscillospiraceae bacterium]|nr:C_GCAxxG_C_C family protein [Oscillospiraceae bacterium]
MDRETQAIGYFMEGYNCAQAVLLAFSDVVGLDEKTCAKLSSSFGGGMGRMREVCGAVSGMLMVAGLLYGYDGPEEGQVKKEHYARVQELAEEFRAEAGSIICREILKNPPSDPAPSPRTAQYYAQRPCARMVALAVRSMEQYIAEHPF